MFLIGWWSKVCKYPLESKRFRGGVQEKNFFVPKNKKKKKFWHVTFSKNFRTCPKKEIFFIFGTKNFFFPGVGQNLLLSEGYLHTLDHRPLKNMNYFPYIFENVTFGSAKPKKYIFRKMGKIIHEKDRKFSKSMVGFLYFTTFGRELFPPFFWICIF